MVYDIGGGTTEVAIISLGGIVTSKSLRVAGDELDQSIISYIRKEFSLMIGERTAEQVKMEIGSAYKLEGEEEMLMEIKGRDMITGLPKIVEISESQVREALKEPVYSIIDSIKTTETLNKNNQSTISPNSMYLYDGIIVYWEVING